MEHDKQLGELLPQSFFMSNCWLYGCS